MTNGYNNTDFSIKTTGDNSFTVTYSDGTIRKAIISPSLEVKYAIQPAVSGTWYTPDGQICQKRKPVYKYQLLNWIGER